MHIFLNALTKNELVKHKLSVVTALSGDICELSKLMILFFLSYSYFKKALPIWHSRVCFDWSQQEQAFKVQFSFQMLFPIQGLKSWCFKRLLCADKRS